MREIEFRAKTIKDVRWIYGDLFRLVPTRRTKNGLSVIGTSVEREGHRRPADTCAHRGNRRDAERCQRQEPTGLHGSRQVLCKQSGIAERSRQFSDEVSWQKVDPTAAAAASGEEDITEGGAGQGGNQGGGTTGGELEG